VNRRGYLQVVRASEAWQPGDEIILTITNPTSASSDIVLDSTTSWTLFQPTHTHTVTFPNHTHPVQPGLKEFSSETAESADRLVNQELVATDIGSGEFTTVVDASGEFVPGDNTITLGSDTLGLVNLTVRTELFRKG